MYLWLNGERSVAVNDPFHNTVQETAASVVATTSPVAARERAICKGRKHLLSKSSCRK